MTPTKVRYRLSIATKNNSQKVIGIGVLSVGEDGSATFFEGDGDENSRILADLQRVRLEWATSFGMKLSGFESTGRLDGRGVPVFHHKEWFVMFCEGEK